MQPKKSPYDLIVITGPTATGKTLLAAHLAKAMQAEIISADSRQVYKGMDIGTGKDLIDYMVDGYQVPVHLVDIVDPGYEFNVFEFQERFLAAYQYINKHHRQAIICGGTGLYLEAALAKYKLLAVPFNSRLRKNLDDLTQDELIKHLASLRKLHNTTDITDRNRLIRAIEIESFNQQHPQERRNYPDFSYIIFAVHFPREIIRERISLRLQSRLDNGMIQEVQNLLKLGLKPQQLTFYGLEYRYVTQYITGEIDYKEMYDLLNIAIHQFAKRQMTWFRKMERNGFKIHWIDGELSMEEKLNFIYQSLL
jgi:tRNA dimethylallyltransferase